MMRTRRKLPLKYLGYAWLQSADRFEGGNFHRAGYVSCPEPADGDLIEQFLTCSHGTGEMAQSVRSLPHNHEDLSSIPSIHVKAEYGDVQCILSTAEIKTGIYLGLTDKPA